MTDLTEQWKKGHLEGFRWYYVKFKTGEIDICWLTEWSNDELGTGGQYFDGIKEENIIEVLAPVPSYDEWQRIFHYASKYEHEYTSCAMDYENLKQENAQLKDLLKQAETQIIAYKNNDTLPERAFYEKEVEELLTKIDEALI